MISDDRQPSLVDAIDVLNNLQNSFELLKLTWLVEDAMYNYQLIRISQKEMTSLLIDQFIHKAESELDEALEILDKLCKVSAKVKELGSAGEQPSADR